MIVEAYGIKLVRLKEEYLELVRYWRNSEAVRNFMEYRDYITPRMQLDWFRSVNNIHNNYFLIIVGDKIIGLISGARINWNEGVTYNGGIFVWEKNFHETVYPAKASVLLTDISFFMGMKKTYAKILKDNPRSIYFNLLMGYSLLPGQEHANNQEYELTADRYFENVKRIRKTIGAEGPIDVLFDDSDNPSSKLAFERLNSIEGEVRSKFNLRTI